MVGESHALYQLASRECVTGKSELAWPSIGGPGLQQAVCLLPATATEQEGQDPDLLPPFRCCR